ncbi:unnamed protein product (macronuclear) [Paramecium tetraurelia]|uniref:YqaJ viral recombinase domain-containing protein n=1 Tax=Paramecium tetraurelia TaxID=5888 RepID=A0CPG0_PARTE|nr:uncharacterized protein GSPATT00009069001 [Paramecium tetraurelia]CAK72677.1 unnamed protein product [Paramecium tetraurelia]|eukprot:XP_001440074.1 hypothetical protein (macronuclear) [Paramecium tetraurelia strain d4-2]
MDNLCKQYLIFKEIDQINLQEYCFYSLDKDKHLSFIYIYDGSAKIECTEFELIELNTLSSYKQEFLTSVTQKLKEMLSNIQPKDEQEILCSLSLDQIFVHRMSEEIIIPKYIMKQLKRSKYRDNHIMININDFYSTNKQNVKTMRKIMKNKLDLNDEVSDQIKQLFETFFQVSIENIQRISIKKQEIYNKYDIQKPDKQDCYTTLKSFHQTHLVNKKKLPEEDIQQIEDFFLNKLLVEGKQIDKQCIEIQNYQQKNQSGLRLTATQIHSICQQESYQKKSQPSISAQKHGEEHEKIALNEYANQHPDIELKQTDVLFNISYPYLCGKPDALVYDLSNNLIGLLEVKSPFIKKELNMNQDENFLLDYIVMDQNNVHQLKRNHQYYYQVQVYLLITELCWCDFIVSTLRGNRVIRVLRDEICMKQIIRKSELYHFTQILPRYCQLQKKQLEEEDLEAIRNKKVFNSY